MGDAPMKPKRVFKLVHDEARRRALEAVTLADDGDMVVVSAALRNLEQNAKFHAICGDLEKSGFRWNGKPRAAQQWKVLLVSGHAVASGEGHELTEGLEGELVNLRESTALMEKPRASSLIEYAVAFCAMHEIGCDASPSVIARAVRFLKEGAPA
jgi:hypothetical protein